MGTILLVILVLLLIGALPSWPYSSESGCYPSGGLGLVLLIVLILVLMGQILGTALEPFCNPHCIFLQSRND